MIQVFGRVVLIMSLIYSPFGYPSTPSNFKMGDVIFMNSFATTHEVFNAYLNINGTPANFTLAVQDRLKKKSEKMPIFHLLENGEVGFAFEGQNYRLARDAKNGLYLNGSRVDLNSSHWKTKTAQHMFFRFPSLIDSAEAALPLVPAGIKLIHIIALAVLATGVACVAPDVSPIFKTELKAKRIRVNSSEFDDLLNSMWADVCPSGVCSACASGTIPKFAFRKHFIKLCSRIAKNYSSTDEVDARAAEMEKIINPRQVPRSAFMVDVAEVHHDFRQKPGNQTPHVAIENRIAIMVADQEFMKSCVKEHLPIMPSSSDTGDGTATK